MSWALTCTPSHVHDLVLVLGFNVYPVPCPRPCPRLFPEPRPTRPEFFPHPANLAWVILDLARRCLVKIFRVCLFWLVDSQLTKLNLHFASTQSWVFVQLVSRQLKLNVGRRGTNQLRLLERYLDVLVKHTTEDPASDCLSRRNRPVCLSRRRIAKMI